MEFKYKITDVAKDFGVPNKKIIDTLAAVTGETKKTGGTVDEQELNYLLEQLTRETAEGQPGRPILLLPTRRRPKSPPPRRPRRQSPPHRSLRSPRRRPPRRRQSSPPPSSKSPASRSTSASRSVRPKSARKSA